MNARYDSKTVKVAAKVRTKADGREGYVTKVGLLRMKRATAEKIDVYFPEKQARGFTFMSRRVYVGGFLEVVERIEDGLELASR